MSEKFWLTIVIVLAVILIGLAGTCGYQYIASAAIARTIDEKHDDLQTAKDTAAALEKAQANSKQLAKLVVRHQAPWTWSEQLPLMVTALTGIAEDSGTVIDTLQPAPVVERQQFARFPLRLTMHMHLASLTTFMRKIQQATPLLAVDQVSIRAGKLPADPLLVEVSVSTYVMLDGPQAQGGRK